ncbi:MAG: ATP-binding cassette domain-containing protein [Bacillales bacterium]|nr:ATP-binding cassette domain-containing protein [Bacillales bacterium]
MVFFGCKNFNKSFGQDLIFENVNLSFPGSGIISIMGKSGCGKSTLIKCLLGIEKCEGEVIFQDEVIKDFSSFRNKYTGLIFQNYNLFEYLSVEENIKTFPNDQGFEKIVNLLDLQDKLKQKVSLLSGGEKQRVAIARTLMKNPKIIFCDEITGSLDEKNALKIMKYLKEISSTCLIINITHNQALASKFSNKILYLKDKTLSWELNSFSLKKAKEKERKLSFTKLLSHSFGLIKKSKVKVILSSISLIISLVLSGCIINVYFSVQNYFERYKYVSLDYNFLELSENETLKVENTSFEIIKQNRPKNLEAINRLISNYQIGNNYSNLINSYTKLTSNNKEINAIFYPTDNSLIRSYNQVIVNQKAYEEIIGSQVLYLNSNQIDYYDSKNVVTSDYFNMQILFNIVGVNQEMNLIDEPIIYYSYDLFIDYLDQIYLPNISLLFDEIITLKDRIDNYTFEGDYYNTGSIYVICKDKSSVEDNMKILKEHHYSCNSRSLTNYYFFSSIIDTILRAIEIFLFLSVVISLALLGLTTSSLIVDQKKEIGVLKSLGVIDEQVNLVVSLEINRVMITCLFFSFLLRTFIYRLLIYFFPNINFLKTNLVVFENLLLAFLVFIISKVFSFVAKIMIQKLPLSLIILEE